MSIDFVSGDIFENRHNVQSIAHGVNLDGVMGAGIAKKVRLRYLAMFSLYADYCRHKRLKLGDVLLWPDGCHPWVFNIATQEHAIRNTASLAALHEGLHTMMMYMSQHRLQSVAMPLIGTGIGGLGIDDVRRMFIEAFTHWDKQVIVYDEYVSGE